MATRTTPPVPDPEVRRCVIHAGCGIYLLLDTVWLLALPVQLLVLVGALVLAWFVTNSLYEDDPTAPDEIAQDQLKKKA